MKQYRNLIQVRTSWKATANLLWYNYSITVGDGQFMENIPYLWINIVALLYFLLMLIMFSFKNSKIYDSFAYLILSVTVWAGAAVFMRTFLYPGPRFWFRISFGSLMLSPLFLYIFVLDYFDVPFNKKKMASVFIVDMLLTIPGFLGLWCDPPVPHLLYGNTIGFSYKVDWMMLPPIAMILYIFWESYNVLKQANKKTDDYKDILIGTGIIIGSNIINLVPENIFPFCMVGGMIGVSFFAKALYKKKLFKVNTNISKQSILLMSYITVCFLALPYISIRIDTTPTLISSSKHIAIWITASLSTLLLAILFIWLSKKLYFNRNDKLAYETRNYAQTLLTLKGDKESIYELLKATLQNLYGDITIILYTVDRNADYMDIYKTNLHDDLNPRIFLKDRFAMWTKLKASPVKTSTVLSELGMLHDNVKFLIDRYELDYTVPLISNDALIGLLFVGGHNFGKMALRDKKTLASIGSSTSIALRASNMLEELKWELTQDHKTGLYNRKSFLSKLDEKLKHGTPGTFIMYDFDEFKLFNQIYTTHEGDKIPLLFSDCLKDLKSDDMLVSRYATKTFGVFICGTIEDAIEFDGKIRETFANKVEGTIFSCLGFSSGMTYYDGNYRSPTKIISEAKMAVKKVKGTEKNHYEIYNEDMEKDPNLKETGFDLETAEAIAKAIDMKDNYTYRHSNNVATYARMLAKAAGLDPYDQQLIYEAGLIHDVGKIAIPDEILTKPGKLTDEEYEIIKSHVVKSELITKSSAHGYLLYPLVVSHHERWDGKGYPYNKKGNEIPLGGRCLAIADSFDAMTGKRVYKHSMNLAEAREELIRCKGTQFDPDLTNVFVSLIDEGMIILEDQ